MEEIDYSEWTSCEVHGHIFEDHDGEPSQHCRDCQEPKDES
jgi:hypothetical protein